MRCLPLRQTAMIALLLQLIALPAGAYPEVRIHWGGGPFTTPEDPSAVGSTPPGTITVTVKGLTGTIKGWELRGNFYAGGSALPDAWRFDPNGCAASRLTINQNIAPGYPLLTGSHRQEYTRFEYYDFPPGGLTQGGLFSYLAAVFDPIVADPNVTYTLLRYDIDHTGMLSGPSAGGQCGCMERGMCISLGDVQYLDGDNNEISMFVSRPALNWNDPANELSCGGQWCDLSPVPCPWTGDTLCVANDPTPAARASWGRVKGSYR